MAFNDSNNENQQGGITMLDLGEFVLAAGALGTAAMGIVELFKAPWKTPFGFKKLSSGIDWAKDAL